MSWMRDGEVRGKVGALYYEATLARGPVSYGLNPRTLYKGGGRILRLSLWTVTPTGGKDRMVLFSRGWRYGRRSHLAAVRRVVRSIDPA